MRAISFTEDVRAEIHEAAAAKGYATAAVNGCLAAIARDIGRDFDSPGSVVRVAECFFVE